ncbi:MAG: hypothetical protein COA79_25635 [Planctomycetota bacterium]|nr:MAG: hypothetical protein COA79_25635 [Planctomycetota bacterium]
MREIQNTSHSKIINGFFNSKESIADIAKACDAADAYARAIISIHDFSHNKSFFLKTEMEVEKLIYGKNTSNHEITQLLTLFWITTLVSNEKINKATKLFSFASSIFKNNSRKEMRSALFVTEGYLESSKGNKTHRIKCFDNAIKNCNKGSPFFFKTLSSCRTFYAELGRLVDYKKKYSSIDLLLEREWHDSIFISDIINDIETCKRKITFSDLKTLSDKLKPSERYLMQKLEATAYLVNDQLKEFEELNPVGKGDYSISTYFLLKNEKLKALELIKDHIKATGKLNSPAGLIYRAPIRAELVNGNHEAAFQLLQKIIDSGGWHYSDDFCLARIELLKNNPTAAVKYFSSAYHWCNYYEATKRLEFEISLSYEIKPKDLWYLSQNISKKENKSLQIRSLTHFLKDEISLKGIKRLIGESQSIVGLRKTIKKYASLKSSILITGETGVGKDVVAKSLHEESIRKGEPFIPINCASITESLLQSELFGHESGAFTGAVSKRIGVFEATGKGTLFLDEIGEISSSVQKILLRVLESNEIRPVGSNKPKKISCRIIFATNAPLEQLVDDGTFRKDLYYRIKKLEIIIIPLRERPKDILPLVYNFLTILRTDRQTPKLSKELEENLLSYSWPGNVRELKNEIDKMRLLKSESLIFEKDDFSLSDKTKIKKLTPLDHNNKNNEQIDEDYDQKQFVKIAIRGNSSLRRLQRIKKLFINNNELTRAEISKIIDVSSKTIGTDLKILMSENFVIKIKPTKSTRSHYYQLK